MNKIVQLVFITSEDAEYDGSLIGLKDNGEIVRVQVGHDDRGPCVKITPLPEVIPS